MVKKSRPISDVGNVVEAPFPKLVKKTKPAHRVTWVEKSLGAGLLVGLVYFIFQPIRHAPFSPDGDDLLVSSVGKHEHLPLADFFPTLSAVQNESADQYRPVYGLVRTLEMVAFGQNTTQLHWVRTILAGLTAVLFYLAATFFTSPLTAALATLGCFIGPFSSAWESISTPEAYGLFLTALGIFGVVGNVKKSRSEPFQLTPWLLALSFSGFLKETFIPNTAIVLILLYWVFPWYIPRWHRKPLTSRDRFVLLLVDMITAYQLYRVYQVIDAHSHHLGHPNLVQFALHMSKNIFRAQISLVGWLFPWFGILLIAVEERSRLGNLKKLSATLPRLVGWLAILGALVFGTQLLIHGGILNGNKEDMVAAMLVGWTISLAGFWLLESINRVGFQREIRGIMFGALTVFLVIRAKQSREIILKNVESAREYQSRIVDMVALKRRSPKFPFVICSQDLVKDRSQIRSISRYLNYYSEKKPVIFLEVSGVEVEIQSPEPEPVSRELAQFKNGSNDNAAFEVNPSARDRFGRRCIEASLSATTKACGCDFEMKFNESK